MADENTSTATETTDGAPPEAAITPDGSAPAGESQEGAEGKDKPAVDPAKERAEKLAQTVADKLARRKARVREGEANLARAREEFNRQQAALQERAKEIEQHRQLVARANEGDIEAMQALGWDYDKTTQALLKRGTPDEKIGALQKQLEAERKAREAKERQEQEAQQRAVIQQAERNFLAVVQSGSYPEASLYDPAELVATGHIIADQLAQETGRAPSLQAVAAEIERRLSERHAKIREAAEKRKAAEAEAAAKADPKGKGKTSETLTNRDAGERGQAPVRELTEAEKRERFARFTQEHLLSGD